MGSTSHPPPCLHREPLWSGGRGGGAENWRHDWSLRSKTGEPKTPGRTELRKNTGGRKRNEVRRVTEPTSSLSAPGSPPPRPDVWPWAGCQRRAGLGGGIGRRSRWCASAFTSSGRERAGASRRSTQASQPWVARYSWTSGSRGRWGPSHRATGRQARETSLRILAGLTTDNRRQRIEQEDEQPSPSKYC